LRSNSPASPPQPPVRSIESRAPQSPRPLRRLRCAASLRPPGKLQQPLDLFVPSDTPSRESRSEHAP
jgi:hypothetical protein